MMQELRDIFVSYLQEAPTIKTARREIMRVVRRPIQRLIRAFNTAQVKRTPTAVTKAHVVHQEVATFAHDEGFPNLERQVKSHEKKIPKPKKEPKPVAKKSVTRSATRPAAKHGSVGTLIRQPKPPKRTP